MIRARVAGALVAVGVTIGSSGVAGQDLEMLSKRSGIPLPQAYYQQIRQDPDFYEFERALFNRVEPGRTAASGDVTIPVVLILFADSPEQPVVTRDMVHESLFTGPAARGTITESYLEMSRGALTVRGETYGWLRSSLTLAEVMGTSNGLGSDGRVGEYFVEALDELDATVDFAQYDNDGPDGVANSGDDDGVVDVVTFEYLEVAASCGGPAIWPHRSRMESRTGEMYLTDDLGIGGDPIYIQDYITQSASDCGGNVVQDASVITHEFGHALGLPDYYHWIDFEAGPFGRRWVMGCWALMAAGSWGCGPVTEERAPFGPTHMMAYSKEELGWVDYFEIGEVWNEEVILDPMVTSGQPLRIQLDETGEEALIAEYRTLTGFDDELPGAGVLLYKYNANGFRRPDPTGNDPYLLTMLEQDQNMSLRLMATENGSRGEIGDAWGVGGVSSRSLNADTEPLLRLNNGAWPSVVVHEVYAEGDQARLVISTGRTPTLVQPSEAFEVTQVRTFSAPARIAGGRGPYTGVGELPEGFSLQPVGDELFLVGSLRDVGPYQYSFAVRDVNGATSNEVTIEVSAPTEWAVEVASLLQQFLASDAEALTPGELDYLDEVGNDNGRYDVGDLRRWLREND